MNYKYTVSIKKDTNRIISSSEDKFAGINDGSLIKIENDPTLYTVLGKESSFYLKSFIAQDSKIITIDEDTGINLQNNDTIRITFNTKGGVLSFDISIGSGQPTTLEVTEVNDAGGVEQLGILEAGKYITHPIAPIATYGNRGDGLLLDIKYLELGNRSFLERTITDIYFQEGKTYLVLDYSLPLNLTSGKLSCEKNVLLLSNNYTGDTKRNISYETFSHFTPNIRLPMLLKNSMSSEVVFNKACLIIDEQIGIIKKHLGIK